MLHGKRATWLCTWRKDFWAHNPNFAKNKSGYFVIKFLSDQVIILSCHGMCKIMADLSIKIIIRAEIIFTRFQLWALSEMNPSLLADFLDVQLKFCLWIMSPPWPDSFTVSLHSPSGRQIGQGCARGLSVASQNHGNSHWSSDPISQCDWGNPNLYLDQPITKGLCQTTGGHALYPTDSPTANMPGLCNSLSAWLTALSKHLLPFSLQYGSIITI